MPKMPGVYKDGQGGWYFKARTAADPLTGRRQHVTRRGFATATEAARARRLFLESDESSAPVSTTGRATTIAVLLDRYLADAETSGHLAPKTLFDYRHFAEHYICPWIGDKTLAEVTPETIAAWQIKLLEQGATRSDRGLSPNTVRLARAPLNGAYKLALRQGLVRVNPLSEVALPRKRRSVPKHWTPEQSREFLALTEGDRNWPIWAFLLGAGLRIGELVALRWRNVDLEVGVVRIVDFVSALGYDVVESEGKSRDAVRTVDIDHHLVEILRTWADTQRAEAGDCEHVFTNPRGEPYHPQRLSKVLAQTSEGCGLPRLTAHGLRHTCATLMLSRGVAPKIAAERLGHADATLFTNLYSHVTPTMQRDAADQLGDALFGD